MASAAVRTNTARFESSRPQAPNGVEDIGFAGGFDPADYREQRLFAPAKDGVPVPISLVFRPSPAERRSGARARN